jgi:hypothetical protein
VPVTRPVQGSLLPDVVPDRPVGPILPSVFAGSNADLIAAVAPLYLTGSVLDMTYGEGAWWERFVPDPFTYHDRYKVDGVDFAALPEADDSFDTACYDPPYVISGGESTKGVGDFQHRYGIGLARLKLSSPFETFIVSGALEAMRVSRQYVLVKCMEFAQGGRFHDIPHAVTAAALAYGWHKHDMIVHNTGSGPGGHNIFDVQRARRHHSYLIVLGAP